MRGNGQRQGQVLFTYFYAFASLVRLRDAPDFDSFFFLP